MRRRLFSPTIAGTVALGATLAGLAAVAAAEPETPFATAPDAGMAAEAALATDGGTADAGAASPVPAPVPEAQSLPADAGVSAGQPELQLGENVKDLAELDLEALLQNTVVTATKTEVKEDEAPAIATVIGRDEIRRWGYRSVEEALRHVAGTYLIDDQIIPNLGIRGVSGGLRSESGLVKVMIDGHSVAFRSTAGNWLGAELVPLSAVQQIEVIRGPASALYGADAFLGVINIVTRRPEDVNGGELAVNGNYQGSTLSTGQDAVMGAVAGKLKLLASYRLHTEDHSGMQLSQRSPGPRLMPYSSSELSARDLIQRSSVGFIKASYQASPKTLLSIAGYFSQLDRGAEFADWAQLTHGIDAGGRRNGTDVSLRQGMIDVRADIALTPQLDLRVDGMFFAGGPTSRDRIEVGSDTYYIKRDFGYRGMDLGAEVSWRPREKLSVLAGIGYLIDYERLTVARSILKMTIDATAAGAVQTSRSGDRDHVTFSSPAAHAQVIWSPLDRLTIAAGARYDHHNVYGGRFSSRLGGVFKLAERVHVKLLYGSAFKAPSPQLLYGFPLASGDISGNPKLKPSYVHTVEAQLSFRPGRYVYLTSGVAGSYLMNQAEFTQQGDNQVARNVARTLSLSWETELRVDYKKLVVGYANVAYNRTVRRTDERGYVADLTSYGNLAYPAVIANAGLSAKLAELPLRLGVEGSFVSARRASRTNTLAYGALYEYKPYFLLGATLQTVGVSLIPERETVFRLVGRNLAGTRIIDPGFAGVDYPQLGRTVMLDIIQEW